MSCAQQSDIIRWGEKIFVPNITLNKLRIDNLRRSDTPATCGFNIYMREDTAQSKVDEFHEYLKKYIKYVGHWSDNMVFICNGVHPERQSLHYTIRLTHRFGLDHRPVVIEDKTNLYLWIANTLSAMEISEVRPFQPVQIFHEDGDYDMFEEEFDAGDGGTFSRSVGDSGNTSPYILSPTATPSKLRIRQRRSISGGIVRSPSPSNQARINGLTNLVGSDKTNNSAVA